MATCRCDETTETRWRTCEDVCEDAPKLQYFATSVLYCHPVNALYNFLQLLDKSFCLWESEIEVPGAVVRRKAVQNRKLAPLPRQPRWCLVEIRWLRYYQTYRNWRSCYSCIRRNNRKLRTMNEKVSTKIDALDAKMSSLSAELTAVRERVGAVESSAEFHETELQNQRKALNEERRARARTVILAERYSRKPDVIFRGIPFRKDEDCTRALGEFLTTELHMELKPTVAVHRLSKPTAMRPNPPLLVRFVNFHDRDRVLFEGRKLRGNNKGLAVYEHLPPPLQLARGKLVAERDEVIKNKGKASIVVPPKTTCAILFVDGKEKKRIDAVDLLLNSEDITSKPT